MFRVRGQNPASGTFRRAAASDNTTFPAAKRTFNATKHAPATTLSTSPDPVPATDPAPATILVPKPRHRSCPRTILVPNPRHRSCPRTFLDAPGRSWTLPGRSWTLQYAPGRSCNAPGRCFCCCRSHRTLQQRSRTLFLLLQETQQQPQLQQSENIVLSVTDPEP